MRRFDHLVAASSAKKVFFLGAWILSVRLERSIGTDASAVPLTQPHPIIFGSFEDPLGIIIARPTIHLALAHIESSEGYG